MKLRTAISQVKGLHYLMESMQLQSSLGKRYLLDTYMMYQANEINQELDLVERTYTIREGKKAGLISKIQTKLMQVRDIKGSLKNIQSNSILDDIELFEIKSFALVSNAILKLQNEFETTLIEIPDLNHVISILDPENNSVPSFYIYDAYSKDLAITRKKIQELKAARKLDPEMDLGAKLDILENKAAEIEAEVRTQVCENIYPYSNDLEKALNQVAHLDVIIAKAILADNMAFTRAQISESTTEYKAMFHPQIKEALALSNKKFQAIDIKLNQSVCFITGANMAGKTVILKTLALCQYLLQFGFFVPAQSAHIALVNRILVSVGDDQSEQNGLSSFASEMVKINEMVEASINKENVLVLVDELARTTNPTEGRAIVNAVAEIFNENNTLSVITTHYSGLNKTCRKLRVKGLDKEFKPGEINKNNINDYMDYALVEDDASWVPHEALRIAEILGINQQIIEKANKNLLAKS
ncbi:DNA mismatch repair protein MutS [Ancylomarina sp. 16SWW S1-10-2]|uniref:lysine 5,6-aminomutase reactivase ATPase KamC n=1 Tax=Ancylomarina sp. 16SWW S1-10-2 TaxID=2499681 RepID=UPI0012AD6FB5|nr:DNA mismatch repair protein MutS [Ancylomarina sp. 16SWW S1-10-2]MRT92130.1 DNA mismatch repair protein MutS [Ancylomarina sp. 16SWW S1-10-2]